MFNNAFEEFDGYNTEKQGIEVNSRKNDNDTTMATKRRTKATRNFAPPISNKDITEAMQNAVPEKTQRDNKYCVNLWEEWVSYRAKTTGAVIPHLKNITFEELQHWLCAFVLEIKKDGSVFVHIIFAVE